MRGGRVSAKGDIWSLGITVLETLTGNCGYALSTPLATMFHIGRGTPPNIPEDLDPSARSMICLCTAFDPDQRPHASDLLCTPFIEQGRREAASGEETETLAVLLNLMAMLSTLQIRDGGDLLKRRAKNLVSSPGVATSAQVEELLTPSAKIVPESPTAHSPSASEAGEEAAAAKVNLTWGGASDRLPRSPGSPSRRAWAAQESRSTESAKGIA